MMSGAIPVNFFFVALNCNGLRFGGWYHLLGLMAHKKSGSEEQQMEGHKIKCY